MRGDFPESDWRIFRDNIAAWQEQYMDRLNKEYIELLSGDGAPSEKFWALDKRIRSDKKKVGVQVHMSRSDLLFNITSLLNEGAIGEEELSQFSDSLQSAVKFFSR